MGYTKEQKAEYMREYYKNNPDKLEEKKQKDRERYHANRERKLEYQRKYYEENKDSTLARQAVYREESRIIISEAKKAPCADCKQRFPEVCMQFHHLDPSTKTNTVSALGHPTTVKKEIAKCIVICANCHCIRHGENDE